jgi:hypothetical protein
MTRGFFAGLLVTLLACSGGCGPKADPRVVYQIKTNDYEIEFDGQQKKATIGSGHFVIVRLPEDIRVSEGQLTVGKRDYGAVRSADKISVVGGKVLVNGQVRTPSGS